MNTGAKGSAVIFQTLSSPLLHPIHKKLDEANTEVILCVSVVTNEALPNKVIISMYVIFSTMDKEVGSVLFTMKRTSSLLGLENVSLEMFEAARLLEIYMAVPFGVTAILRGFVIPDRVSITAGEVTSVTFHTFTESTPFRGATRNVVVLPEAASLNR